MNGKVLDKRIGLSVTMLTLMSQAFLCCSAGGGEKTVCEGVQRMRTVVQRPGDANKMKEALEWNNSGVRLMHEGKIKEAVQAFQTALDISPECVGAAHNLSKLFGAAKQYSQARAVLERTLKILPEDLGCRVQLAQINGMDGRKSDCIHALELFKKEKRADVLGSLSSTFLAVGQPDLAREAVDRAIAVDGNSQVVWFNHARVAEVQGKPEIAEKSYKRALEIKEDDETWVNLGVLYENQRKMEQARRCFEKAVAVKRTPLSEYNLGRFLFLKLQDLEHGYPLIRSAANGEGRASHEARKIILKLRKIAKTEGGAK
ncbi:MAG: tetratricopeptide repeat protein [Kiritimatiellae bacterium]|nr:tetratricopeptide repeat protein [Kiritimatiellia bacterium]